MEDVMCRVPWEVIASFCDFSDVLALRLVSTKTLECVHEGLVAEDCARWLSMELQTENAYAFDVDKWKDASRSAEQVQGLIATNGETTSSMDWLLRASRVVKCLPQRLVVCYSGKYGRHCMPSDGQLLIKYPKCHRGKKNCSTCRFKIPSVPLVESRRTDSRNRTSIADYFRIMTGEAMHLDLGSFYNKCIPNLPSDLVCPSCRVSDRRTLVLTANCYRTEQATQRRRAANVALTFTPAACQAREAEEGTDDNDDDDDNEEEEDNEIEERPFGGSLDSPVNDDNQRPRKRSRIESDPSTEQFPPLVRDYFSPSILDAPVPINADTKLAIAIHCCHCRKFGVLAPSLPRVPNLERISEEGSDLILAEMSLGRQEPILQPWS